MLKNQKEKNLNYKILKIKHDNLSFPSFRIDTQTYIHLNSCVTKEIKDKAFFF